MSEISEQRQRGERLLRDNPALLKPNWLPEGMWPELDELRDRHVKLLEDRAVASKAHADLRDKFEQEDEAQERSASNGAKPPRITPESERTDALQETKGRLMAAIAALAEFVAEAVESIQKNEADWIESLKKRDIAADEKVEEAERLLDEAHRDKHAVKKVRGWVERTAENKQSRHVAYEQLAGPVPPREEASLIGITGAAVEEYA